MSRPHFWLFTILISSPGLSGCAPSSNAASDPGARPLRAGQTCSGIQQELRTLDRRGVPAHVERLSSGGKLTPARRTQANRYNDLLDQYLGARCHV